MNRDQIKEYLHFGYLPAEKNSYPFRVEEVSLQEVPSKEDDVLREAHRVFEQAISDNIPADRNRTIAVPLSGGVDSRIILAELYRQLGGGNLTAFTFGTPGSLDYELPRKVTARFGISHQIINLHEEDFSEKKLLDYAADSSLPTLLLEAYSNDLLRQRMGARAVCFSGFIGDRIVGSMPPHLRETEGFEPAKRLFLTNNRYDKTGILPELEPADFFVPDDDYDFLKPYEKIDYKIRLRNMTTSIVLDSRYDIRTPLIDPRLISFFYSIPSSFRNHKSLFYRMAAACYPDFFEIGVKNFFGAELAASPLKKTLARKIGYGRRVLSRKLYRFPVKDPLENYISPSYFYLRNRKTSEMVERNLKDLKKRDILDGINPPQVFDQLKKGRMEYKHAVELLFNLEIYLKAGAFS